MKLHIADTFRITTGYGKRIFKVLEVTADAFEFTCADTETGELYFFSQKGLELYESLNQLVIIERAEQSAKLDNARKALESAHVKAVEVGFDYESDGVRFYSAVTKDNGVPHLYTVRVWEDSDGATVAKCNCQGNAKGFACRHIGRVAIEDAKRCKRKVYYASFGNYRAHKSNKSERLAA